MNEDKFNGKAEIYDKARPSYPDGVIDYIASFLRTDAAIADIGSGTGRLTELMLNRGFTVFAVEPNEEMRAAAGKRLNGQKCYKSIDGNAENTTLKARSVDCIAVAQALHWFDIEKFRLEANRILTPGGKVFIIYNRFTGTLAAAYEQFLYARCKGFKGLSGGGDTDKKIESFFDGGYTAKTFPFPIIYEEEQFIDRALSSSYTPKFDEAGYTPFINGLKDFFKEYKKDGRITFNNITTVYHRP